MNRIAESAIEEFIVNELLVLRAAERQLALQIARVGSAGSGSYDLSDEVKALNDRARRLETVLNNIENSSSMAMAHLQCA